MRFVFRILYDAIMRLSSGRGRVNFPIMPSCIAMIMIML